MPASPQTPDEPPLTAVAACRSTLDEHPAKPVTIDPDAYTSWRGTWLDATTERLEHHEVLELIEDIAGMQVLGACPGNGLNSLDKMVAS
ncbi:MAG TPA: hypothetical protein PK231_00505 [Acidocella sp.]|jgi:hypothetical protein|uniref:hypothetical protein n=1 Tax=Acidiphilium sp. 20-67-58 TaxID=1970291 RepID=UPI0025C65F9F|nr:hypothetical protein [Acidiphilium sp. 20-67-58]HQT37871.1 hypothetical protein [Acidocella sp.]